jgi:polar amino acid transport system substrate-binding protein
MTLHRWIGRLALLVAALMLPVSALAEGLESGEGDTRYMENAWNFVEESMDVSKGIPSDAEGVLADIRDSGVLRVATEPYFPPQEFIDPDLTGQDSYAGADMALARLIAERMGVALQIVPMDFSEVLGAVSDGSCDLAVSALSYTPGRAAQVTFSKGYYYAGSLSGSGLMIRAADSGIITGVDSLKGRDIGAQSGSLQEAQMYENVFRYRQFRRMGSVQALYNALMDGTIDAAMVDLGTGQDYIDSNPGCGLVMIPGVRFILEEAFQGDRIAARKGEGQLIAFVNGVIDEVLESGQYLAWYGEAEARAKALGL